MPFGLTSLPAILGATIHNHLSIYRENHPEACNILKRFYVDDLKGGCHCIEDGLDIYQTAKEITQSAGFNLRKWTSNSKQLLEHIATFESDSNVTIHSLSDLSNNIGESLSREHNVTGDSLTGEDNQTYAKANTGIHLQGDKTKVLGV